MYASSDWHFQTDYGGQYQTFMENVKKSFQHHKASCGHFCTQSDPMVYMSLAEQLFYNSFTFDD